MTNKGGDIYIESIYTNIYMYKYIMISDNEKNDGNAQPSGVEGASRAKKTSK